MTQSGEYCVSIFHKNFKKLPQYLNFINFLQIVRKRLKLVQNLI